MISWLDVCPSTLHLGERRDFLNGQVSQNDHFFQEQLPNIAERNSVVLTRDGLPSEPWRSRGPFGDCGEAGEFVAVHPKFCPDFAASPCRKPRGQVALRVP